MLGGSSGINYMAYVRGHPGDFDAWADGGATGWSSRRGPGLLQEERRPCRERRHRRRPRCPQHRRSARRLGAGTGPARRAGVRRRRGAAAGIPIGDYNGRDREGDAGVVSLLQTTTRDGKRSSTYHAFLEGDVEQRPNLEVISRRAGDARDPGRCVGSADRTGCRVPNRGRRDVDRRPRQQGSGAQRGCGGFAADPPALRHRTEG